MAPSCSRHTDPGRCSQLRGEQHHTSRSDEICLYKSLSDFPNTKNIIFQTCEKGDVFIHCKVGTADAFDVFVERAAESIRLQLVQLLVELITSEIALQASAVENYLPCTYPNESDVHRALDLGPLSRVIFDSDHGLLRIWKRFFDTSTNRVDGDNIGHYQVWLLARSFLDA